MAPNNSKKCVVSNFKFLKSIFIICSCALVLASCAGIHPKSGEQVSVTNVRAGSYPYLLFVPPSYEPNNPPLPLLIFLHGSGERGSDIEKVKVHGPPKLVQNRPDFPFVVVSPLLEAEGDWDVQKLDRMLAQIRREVRIDDTRIYLTGLSRGGHATWRWAAARPEVFAAIAPIAGRGDLTKACALKQMPVWAFHGDRDSVVDPKGSSQMVAEINHCSGQARLTLYSDTGHDSWSRSYADPELYAWLLAHRKQ